MPLPFAKNTLINRLFNRRNILEQQIRNENGALKTIPLRKMRVDYATGADAQTLENLHHNPEYISPGEGLVTEKAGAVTIPKGKMLVNDDPNNPQFIDVKHPGKHTTVITPDGLSPEDIKSLATNDFVSHAMHGNKTYESLHGQLESFLRQKYDDKMIENNGGVDAYMRGIVSDDKEYQPYRDEMKHIPDEFLNRVRYFIKTGK